MEIVWDPGKAAQNLKKHGVRFADSVLVLDDPYALTVEDSESSPEERHWVTMGADAQGQVSGGGLQLPRRRHSNHFGARRGAA